MRKNTHIMGAIKPWENNEFCRLTYTYIYAKRNKVGQEMILEYARNL